MLKYRFHLAIIALMLTILGVGVFRLENSTKVRPPAIKPPIYVAPSTTGGQAELPKLQNSIAQAGSKAPDQPVSSIVQLNNEDTKSAFLRANSLRASDLQPLPELTNSYVVNRAASNLDNAGAMVSPQRSYNALMTPNDPIYPQWYTDKISAPAAWDITTGSSSVKVAVIDTGFGLNHEDLIGRWAPGGRDFVHNDNDPMAGTTNPGAAAVNHGTKTAGLIGATGNNGRGIASVDWGVKILPLQALSDDGYGTTANVAAAVHYAVDQGAKIINMSFGSPDPDNVLQTEINYAQAHDVVVVAAAGNCGDPSFYIINSCSQPGQILYPAAYPNVISVGATDSNDSRSSFSSYGPELDIMAPGSGTIQTTDWSVANQTSLYSSRADGTSFSAPIVAGAIGLIRSVQTNASAGQVTAMLLNHADKVAGMNNQNWTDFYGYGRLNALSALSTTHPDGTLIFNPTASGVEIIQDGKAAPIFSGAILTSNGYSWGSIKSPTAADNHLAATTALAFREGTLLESQGRVYVIDITSGGVQQKRWVTSWETFVGLGYKISELLYVSPDLLPAQDGPDLTNPAQHPDGSLIYTPNHSGVILIQNGQRRNIIYGEVFNSYGYQWSQIRNPTDSDNSLPVGPDLNIFREGTLINYGGHIYVVDITLDGTQQKRGVASWETFVGLGYNFGEVIALPVTELPAQDGPVLAL